MNRPICVLAIIIIIIILGLHSLGVVFFDYNEIYKYDEKEVNCYAIVLGIKNKKEYKTTYIIKVQSDNILNNKKFLLNLKNDTEKPLVYGDFIYFSGIYNKPNGKRNYSGYDYALYLKTQKIYGTFKSDNINVLQSDKGSIIQKWIMQVKDYIKNVLKNNLEENTANLCIGLIIGDRQNLSKQIEDDFKTSNLTHMLAVSGSHFVYIIMALNFINKFLKKKRLGQILMIVIIIAFMFLTGNTGSVVRSGIMAIIGIIASITHRKNDVWNSMATSIIIQIIINPYIIFDVGVQLSYGGVISIVVFYKKIFYFLSKINKFNSIVKDKKNKDNRKNIKKIEKNSYLEKFKNYVLETTSLTISANIVIIPIMMWQFNTVSFTFLISNLLAGSILGFIVIFAFMLIISSVILNKFIKPLFFILNIFLKLLIQIAHICSQLPFSKIFVLTPNLILIIIFYIILYLFFSKRYSKKILSIILIFIIIINFLFPIDLAKRNDLEINFIDVGQGDSTLIRIDKKNILVDGGGSSFQSSFDVGEMILMPYLLDRRINKLDYVIVSHFDSDHVQGLMYVIKNYKVENVIVSKLGQQSNEYKDFLEAAMERNINIVFIERGNILELGKGYIEFLFPDKELIRDNEKNNNAIVFKLVWKNISALFTGDIEEKAEMKLLELYKDNKEKLEATILKVSHHGSKTSTTKSFLDVVNPQIALIRCWKK